MNCVAAVASQGESQRLANVPVVSDSLTRPLLTSNKEIAVDAVKDLIRETNVQQKRPSAIVSTRRDTTARCASQSRYQK